jgi:hypothetical protein
MKPKHQTEDANPETRPSPTQVMISWFEEKQLGYDYSEENNLILSGLGLENLEVGVECGANGDGAPFVIIRYPVRASESARLAVGEFLHRLNYSIKLSICEMDFNDGEIRLRSVVYLFGNDFGDEHFAAIMAHLLIFSDAVYPYLAGVMARSMKAEFAADQAIAAIHAAYREVNSEDEEP